MTTKRLGLIALLGAALLSSACANTIRGAGADAANAVDATQNAGNRVANAAR
ncbi:MAG: entericidin [Rhizobiaceae bacterium]|jgi:entericidin B